MTACRRPLLPYPVAMRRSPLRVAQHAFIALIIIVTMPASGSERPAPAIVNQPMQAALREHVEKLGGEIGERNLFRPQALAAAAAYITETWRAQGYEVVRREYELRGQRAANLEVTRTGTDRAREILLVGAHYDSVYGSPGANDNGTGVAALLELSRALAARELRRTVRFVAFVNEEPPFFKTAQMGSRVYTRMARERGDNIKAMLCLETIGYYSAEPGSQRYPPLFNLFYPDAGNFIGFVSNFGSRPLLKRAVAAFRAGSDFPLEYVSTFGFVPGVDWSDHWSFWRRGIPAIMVTDTALYRYPHYHAATDTPDKVHYPALARVTRALLGVITALADGESLP